MVSCITTCCEVHGTRTQLETAHVSLNWDSRDSLYGVNIRQVSLHKLLHKELSVLGADCRGQTAGSTWSAYMFLQPHHAYVLGDISVAFFHVSDMYFTGHCNIFCIDLKRRWFWRRVERGTDLRIEKKRGNFWMKMLGWIKGNQIFRNPKSGLSIAAWSR